MKINGVIANWQFNEGSIIGICLNESTIDQSITTSQVKCIWMENGKRYATTQNSVYLLID